MARHLRAWVVLVLIGSIAGCGPLSVQEEKQIGRRAQRQMRAENTLLRDLVTVNYIRELGAELVESARPTPFNIRFYIVEDDDLNAGAYPGGTIIIHTGIIESVEDVSQLASVLAHEIAHVTERHYAKRAKKSRNTGVAAQAAAMAAAILTGNPYIANAADLGAGIVGKAYLAGYSREDESAADTLAIETLTNAAYDPEGMIEFFEYLNREQGSGGGPGFLMTHPSASNRAERTRALVTEAKAARPGREWKRNDGGKLEIIQRRLELIIGTDFDVEDEVDDELDEQVEGEVDVVEEQD
ncbi:MAG: M48 family metalloprotease [Myxococcota bacterium]